MSIELIRERGRTKVSWLEAQPSDEAINAFLDRGYDPSRCSEADLEIPELLRVLSAVVFVQDPEKLGKIARDLERHAQRLMNYGCLLILRWTTPSAMVPVARVVERLGLPTEGMELPRSGAEPHRIPGGRDEPSPHIRIFNADATWSDVANFVAENGARFAPNLALKITVEDLVDETGVRQKREIDDQSALFIRRAFYEQLCTEVHLVPMDNGKPVYLAYPTIGGVEGPWQQPRFVKIDSRDKILTEYRNYELFVDPYVPFHLRPHLDRDRCCLGGEKGIIVGDYVGSSESLHACACAGRAGYAIACLFDLTLFAWHNHAKKEETSIGECLLRRFQKLRKFPPQRIERARELGAALGLDDLRALFMRCKSRPVLAGSIHGDLHAANVLVRGADAIVIDFFGRRKGPLVYDAACLEASLLIKGFANDDKGWDLQEWLRSLEPLYERPVLSERVMQSDPKNRAIWFHRCVHQIRRYARQWDCGNPQDQYAAALALALLEKASKDEDVSGPEADRRAAAYFLAERVLKQSFPDQAEVGISAVAT